MEKLDYTAITAEQVDKALQEELDAATSVAVQPSQEQTEQKVEQEAKQERIVIEDVSTDDILDVSGRRINAPTYRR